jgi:hypothetical protein
MIAGNTILPSTNDRGCLTIPNFRQAAGEDTVLSHCFFDFAVSDQGFSLVPDFTVTSPLPTPGRQFRYRFINWHSGMCLEVYGGSTTRGARVQQAPCNGSFQQYWIVTT